ncbi:hypothetical protein BX661DRAFT_95062 [Kickxella alabastrina]|uniref:uncharacterized protein n=1 Tax=Kickxella alabastrina TaxID=61397 RepID=UPI002220FA52|nr:uncharacterized protein BX661DRAFT_95062 [Kickxella alabastrina]KAI7829895.1 hypothetical protein BX661DRAFT_95062 [Kickxella alabastrina]
MSQTADKREMVVVGINTTIMFISFLALLYVNYNRSYIPLKCKNIPLLNILYLTIFCWYLGDIYTYQPSLVYASRSICIATMSWLRMSFGVYSVISCHIFRIYQYHCIFQWHRRANGKYLWVPIGLWLIIPLVYGIIAAALPESLGTSFVISPEMCFAQKTAYFVALAFLLILMACWTYATLLMKYTDVCFNEYRELAVIIVSTVFVISMQVVLRWVPQVGDSGFAYNAMTSMTDLLIGQVSFYALIWRPAYHCLVDRDNYLALFLRTLKKENRKSEYELANGEELYMISFDCTGETGVFMASSADSFVKVLMTSDDSNDYHPATAYCEDLEKASASKPTLV